MAEELEDFLALLRRTRDESAKRHNYDVRSMGHEMREQARAAGIVTVAPPPRRPATACACAARRLRVTAAEVRGPSRLWLAFSDGTEGEADVTPFLHGGPVFGPLRDPAFFARATLDTVCGVVTWPNGADFAPEALRALVGDPVPTA